MTMIRFVGNKSEVQEHNPRINGKRNNLPFRQKLLGKGLPLG